MRGFCLSDTCSDSASHCAVLESIRIQVVLRLNLLDENALARMTQDAEPKNSYSKDVSRTSSSLPSGGALE